MSRYVFRRPYNYGQRLKLRVMLYLAAVAGGATQLVVQDSACIVESEGPTLTQHQTLSVDDSECVVESEAVALTQHQVLVVGDSECVAESEEPSLTQHQVLVVGDSKSIVTSGNVVLSFGTTNQSSMFLVA